MSCWDKAVIVGPRNCWTRAGIETTNPTSRFQNERNRYIMHCYSRFWFLMSWPSLNRFRICYDMTVFISLSYWNSFSDLYCLKLKRVSIFSTALVQLTSTFLLPESTLHYRLLSIPLTEVSDSVLFISTYLHLHSWPWMQRQCSRAGYR